MSSDTSDSEEENIELFREALDDQFINNDLYKPKDKTKKSEVTKKEITQPLPKSLRRNIVDEDESFNIFKVTPQFQTYVSNQLPNILEKQLQDVCVPNVTTNERTKKWKSKVKLLRDSKSNLKIRKISEDDCHEVPKKTIKSKLDDKQYEENRQKKCREVALEPRAILNKEDTTFWSNRSKAPIFVYKRDCTGQLISKEKTFV